MCVRRVWDVWEWRALFGLYEESGRTPPRWAVEEFRATLVADAPEGFGADPSYRTVDSIRQQLGWVQFISERHLRAPEAPVAAWSAFRLGAVEWRTGATRNQGADPPHLGGGYRRDREAIARALGVLEEAIEELVSSDEFLPADLLNSYRRSWTDIRQRGYLALAVDALGGHAVDDLLATQGLVGLQRVAKTASIDHAVEERRRSGGWKPLKALLGYLDSVLGSLVKVFTWLEPIKEFKEITEKSAELANEIVPE